MHLRSIVLWVTVLAIAALAALNWPALAAPSLVSLGIVVFEAPLGLIMLGLTGLLGIFFIVYVLSLQGSVLMETRRHTKEMQVQRELADKAEASRFTELRAFLDAQRVPLNPTIPPQRMWGSLSTSCERAGWRRCRSFLGCDQRGSQLFVAVSCNLPAP